MSSLPFEREPLAAVAANKQKLSFALADNRSTHTRSKQREPLALDAGTKCSKLTSGSLSLFLFSNAFALRCLLQTCELSRARSIKAKPMCQSVSRSILASQSERASERKQISRTSLAQN